MTILTNNIQNNALAAMGHMAGSSVMSAIQSASVQTGVDFAYLLQQASAESGFNPAAKAKTSSASGLYQFIESTWLSMVEKHGPKHGIATEGMSRHEILNLRNDPKAASVMAAEFASENKQFLESHYDGEIGSTELYFAHFLGAGSAAAFLNARAENGLKEAATIFPAAAKANRAVFYDQTTGRAKTLDEVYAHFDKKFNIEEQIKPEIATDMAAKSYQDPFQFYPEKAVNTATKQAAAHNETRRAAYNSLLANPLEVTFLSQMMDLPINRKSNEFQLFSTYSLFK